MFSATTSSHIASTLLLIHCLHIYVSLKLYTFSSENRIYAIGLLCVLDLDLVLKLFGSLCRANELLRCHGLFPLKIMEELFLNQ